MKVRIKQDSVEIEGYVNAIERASKPLMSRVGQFIERICKGAFQKALKRNNDVHILLNHDWSRDLGSTKQGNLELCEDNIGLHARAIITDKEVIEKARNGQLVGWSFGFQDRDVDNSIFNGMPHRAVKDLDLFEVSILDKTKTPAYEGTLITARSEDQEMHFRGEEFIDEVKLVEIGQFKESSQEKEDVREIRTTEQVSKQQEIVEEIDYTQYETMIQKMKEED